jgi:hypothetical protein
LLYFCSIGTCPETRARDPHVAPILGPQREARLHRAKTPAQRQCDSHMQSLRTGPAARSRRLGAESLPHQAPSGSREELVWAGRGPGGIAFEQKGRDYLLWGALRSGFTSSSTPAGCLWQLIHGLDEGARGAKSPCASYFK